MFPTELHKGDTFTDLAVAVQQNDPATGIIGPDAFVPVGALDTAAGSADFRW